MARLATIFGLMAASLVSAMPLEERTSGLCSALDFAVILLKAYPSASPFCSSFLEIQTATKTSTVSLTSPVTSVIPTTTTTVYVAASPVTSTSSFSTTITTCLLNAAKRDVEKRLVMNPSTTTITSGLTCDGAPALLRNIACGAISSACGCLSIPTQTSTVYVSTTLIPTITSYSGVAATVTTTDTITVSSTSTSTVISCPTPSICGNKGIQFAYYANEPWDDNVVNMEPKYYWDKKPDYNSTTTEVGGINEPAGQTVSIYGSTEAFSASYFVLNHRGYIFAQTTGTYTFATSNADDVVFLYVGQDAYSGYSASNADAKAVCCSSPANSASTTYTLAEGDYMPFRIVFGQQGGPVIFSFSITAPDGTVILDSSTQDSDFIVQYSCDGTTAPAFLDWGEETVQ